MGLLVPVSLRGYQTGAVDILSVEELRGNWKLSYLKEHSAYHRNTLYGTRSLSHFGRSLARSERDGSESVIVGEPTLHGGMWHDYAIMLLLLRLDVLVVQREEKSTN